MITETALTTFPGAAVLGMIVGRGLNWSVVAAGAFLLVAALSTVVFFLLVRGRREPGGAAPADSSAVADLLAGIDGLERRLDVLETLLKPASGATDDDNAIDD